MAKLKRKGSSEDLERVRIQVIEGKVTKQVQKI
jgi:hypothetical protein